MDRLSSITDTGWLYFYSCQWLFTTAQKRV
jgi:hypothetical protein